MSLARRERRTLRKIEADIVRSDPALARMLDRFQGIGGEEAAPVTEHGPGTIARAWDRGLAVAVPAARLVVRGIGAVTEGGVRERLGVRTGPQPMGRSPWQRLT